MERRAVPFTVLDPDRATVPLDDAGASAAGSIGADPDM
jgi:hypothetical protein